MRVPQLIYRNPPLGARCPGHRVAARPSSTPRSGKPRRTAAGRLGVAARRTPRRQMLDAEAEETSRRAPPTPVVATDGDASTQAPARPVRGPSREVDRRPRLVPRGQAFGERTSARRSGTPGRARRALGVTNGRTCRDDRRFDAVATWPEWVDARQRMRGRVRVVLTQGHEGDSAERGQAPADAATVITLYRLLGDFRTTRGQPDGLAGVFRDTSPGWSPRTGISSKQRSLPGAGEGNRCR